MNRHHIQTIEMTKRSNSRHRSGRSEFQFGTLILVLGLGMCCLLSLLALSSFLHLSVGRLPSEIWELVTEFSEQPIMVQFRAMSLFTTVSFIFAAAVREKCKDPVARMAARVVGFFMFSLLILFSWEMAMKAESIADGDRAGCSRSGDVIMYANKEAGE